MTAPVTPEMLDELERLDAVATIDWQPGVYWPYDDTADIAYGCKLRNAAPVLIAAARERDALAAEVERLRIELRKADANIVTLTDRLVFTSDRGGA